MDRTQSLVAVSDGLEARPSVTTTKAHGIAGGQDHGSQVHPGVWRMRPKHITDLTSVAHGKMFVVGWWRRFDVVSKLDQGDRKRK